MATIINNPPAQESSSSPVGVIVGILIALVLGILIIMYVLPTIRNGASQTAPQVNVPDKIDVNVQQPQQ